MSIILTEDQDKALEGCKEFLRSKDPYMVISGSSGSGKSTLTPFLIKAAEDYYDTGKAVDTFGNSLMDICLCATTNPAAAVLQDMCLKEHEVKTIHSLCGVF